MHSTLNVTQDTFEDKVLRGKGLIMVDFWAEWCPPCRVLGPIMESIADEHKDIVTVAKLDVEANPGLAQEYDVRGIPTVMLFKDGEALETWVGLLPKSVYVDRIKSA